MATAAAAGGAGDLPRGGGGGFPTPAHAAAAAGDVTQLERALADAPLAINAPNHTGRTPLHVAAAHGHAAAVRLLLRHGALKAVRDGNGQTPVELAREFGFPAVAAALDPQGPEARATGKPTAPPKGETKCSQQ